MTPRSQSSSIQQDPTKGFLILLQLSNRCCQRWVLGRRFHNLYPQKPWYFAWSCIYVSRNRLPTAWICFMSWSSIKRPFSVRLWYNRPIALLAVFCQKAAGPTPKYFLCPFCKSTLAISCGKISGHGCSPMRPSKSQIGISQWLITFPKARFARTRPCKLEVLSWPTWSTQELGERKYQPH